MAITWTIAKTAKDLWDKAVDAVAENTDVNLPWIKDVIAQPFWWVPNTDADIEVPDLEKNNNTEAGVFNLPWINDNITRDIPQDETESPYSNLVWDLQDKWVEEIKEDKQVVTDKTEPRQWDMSTFQEQQITEQPTKQIEQKQELSKEDPTPSQEDLDKLNMEKFNDALDKWATSEDIQKFANENPELLPEIRTAVTGHFQNKSNVEFFNKFNWASNEFLYDAMKNWDFTTTDEQYALLSPQQKADFENYAKLEDIKNISDPDKDDVVSSDLIIKQDYIDALSQNFSSTTRQNIDAIQNSAEYKQVVTDLEAKQTEIDAMNDSIRDIWDEIKSLHKWVPASVINWIIADQTKSLTNKKNTLINEYNAKAGTLSNFQNQIDIELQVSQIEDANQKWIYETALEQYTSDRKSMTDLAIKEFEAENEFLANDIKHQRTLELEAFKAWLKKEEKWWVYKTDREWKLLYVVDWVSREVTSSLWDVVFTEEDKDKGFKDTTYSSDWVFTTVRTYDTWAEPTYFTHSVNWTSTSTMSIYDAIAGIDPTWLQCGEAVNKYVSSLWVDPKDFWVWNTYESKAKYIDESIDIPQPWDVAIWNNWSVDSATWEDYWHIWIITWPVQKDWTVEITDWNIDWKETKSTRMVKLDTIKNSDWWFYSPSLYTEWQKAFLEWFDWKVTSTTKATMKELWLTAEDAYAYKSWAITGDDAIQIRKATDMISSLKWMLDLGRMDRMTSWLVQYTPFFWDNEADFRADFNFLKGQLTLQNLIDLKAWWATFGALSNEELKMIENSATKLAMNLSNDKWNEEVNKLVDVFEDMITRTWGQVDIEPEPINSNNADILQEYNKAKGAIDLSYLD